MQVRLSALRQVIREALSDHVRLPRGPNSRDDADDRPLGDPMDDRPNVEEVDDTRLPPEDANLPLPGQGYGSKRGLSTKNKSNHNTGT